MQIVQNIVKLYKMAEENKKDREITAKQKKMFLEHLPKMGYHIAKTCEKVGVHRNTFLYWKKNDDDFKLEYEAVEEQRIDDSEERLYLLGNGIPEIKDGKLVGWVVKPNVRALEIHLKAKAKSRGYGDHIVIDDKRDDDDGYKHKTEDELREEMEKTMKRITGYNAGKESKT